MKPLQSVETKLERLELLIHNREYEKVKTLIGEMETEMQSLHPPLIQARFANVKGELHWYTGEIRKALPHFQKAQELREKHLPEDDPLLGESHNNLGVAYKELGNYPQAENHYLLALKIRQQVLEPAHPDTVQSLSNLAMLYRLMGRYPQAEAALLEAIQLQEEAGRRDGEYARCLNNLGVLYLSLGLYTRSEKHLEQAREIRKNLFGEDSMAYAESLNNLGSLYMRQNTYDKAEKVFLTALGILSHTLPLQHPAAVKTTKNLAEAYTHTGKYAQAHDLFNHTLQRCKELFGEDHLLYARFELGQAMLLWKEDRLEEMRDRLLSTIERIQNAASDQTVDYAEACFLIGMVLWRLGERETAWNYLIKGATIRNRILPDLVSSLPEAEVLSFLHTLQPETHFLIECVEDAAADHPSWVQELYNALLPRKALALEVHTAQRANYLSSQYPQLTALFEAWKAAKNHLTQLLLGGRKGMGKEDFENERQRLQEQCDQYDTQLAAKVPELAVQNALRKATFDKIHQHLPPSSLLVECFRYIPYDFTQKQPATQEKARYGAIVIHPHHAQPKWVYLGDAHTIDGEIQRFLDHVEGNAEGRSRSVSTVQKDRTPDHYFDELSTRPLYELLLAPIQDAIRAWTRHHPTKSLILSPDGHLCRLPFEALMNEDGSYLIEEYTLRYLNSGRELLPRPYAPSSSPKAVIIADLDFDYESKTGAPQSGASARGQEGQGLIRNGFSGLLRARASAGKGFEALPGTRQESESLQKMLADHPWDPIQVFTGDTALEGEIKKVKSPGLLHISTHGYFLEDRSSGQNQELDLHPLLRSGLILTGINPVLIRGIVTEEVEDAVLTAMDVTTMDLSGTRLVVLSACETGLGEIYNGEGILGLRRSFQLAGAENVIMSLWKVSDMHTKDLMTAFYTHWLNGEDPSESLRKAQIEMIDQLYERYGAADPFLWAGFIVQG